MPRMQVDPRLADAPTDHAGAFETDALIVGAGPVGLFQVFELGLLEIRAHVVDSLPHPGGQCVELYADKPIYDIPSVLRCTGRELVDRLLRQIEPFAAPLHLGQVVSQVERQSDGRFLVATSQGMRFVARTLIVAGGVGAFLPRRIKVAGIEAFEGRQLVHNLDDPGRFAGQHVVIVGAGDEALAAALQLAQAGPQQAASLTLVHRRELLSATAEHIERVQALCAAGAMRFVVGQPVGFTVSGDRLSGLQVALADGTTQALMLDGLLVCLGLSPKLGPIADWGLGLDHKQVVVDTEKFETSVPGIFAIGDIATYPGKKKLILSGFHEAALAAFGVAAHVFPGQRVPLQYTTTSPRLHQLLGVVADAASG